MVDIGGIFAWGIILGVGLIAAAFIADRLGIIPFLQAVAQWITAIFSSIGKIFDFAPRPLKVFIFVLTGGILIGVLVNWIIAANVVCSQCVPYETRSLLEGAFAKTMDSPYVCTETGVVNPIATAESGVYKTTGSLSKVYTTSFGTFMTIGGNTVPALSDTNNIFLAMPYDFDVSKIGSGGLSAGSFLDWFAGASSSYRLFVWVKNPLHSPNLFWVMTANIPGLSDGQCWIGTQNSGGLLDSHPIELEYFMNKIKNEDGTTSVRMRVGYHKSGLSLQSLLTAGLSTITAQSTAPDMSLTACGTTPADGMYLLTPGSEAYVAPETILGAGLNSWFEFTYPVNVTRAGSGYVKTKYVSLYSATGDTTLSMTGTRVQFVKRQKYPISNAAAIDPVSYGCKGNDQVKVLFFGIDLFEWQTLAVIIVLFSIVGVLKWLGVL